MSEQQKFKEVHLYTRSINQYLERIAANLGWKQLSLMTARHSYASIALNERVPIEAISESMAHSSIATTANYLKGFDRESKKQFAEILTINIEE